MINRIGLDHYEISMTSLNVARNCRKHHLSCYLLEQKDQKTYFSMKIIDRKKTKALFPQAKLIYTSGVLGMLLRNGNRKDHVIGYLVMAMVWYILSSSILHIDVIGENDRLQAKIEDHLASQRFHFKHISEMKSELLNTFHNDVSWLEVYEKGSIIKVRYAPKEKIKKKTSQDRPLIAKKEGMIVSFRIKEGVKVKKVNDLVRVGDVLVDNIGLTSNGETFSTNVDGQVFAHTWQKVNITINNNKLPEAVNYFSMLMDARNQIDIDYEWGERIVDENILHFEHKQDKIVLEILYTVLEDITS